MTSDRVDVHTHLIPPFWAKELETHGGDPSGWHTPKWSPDQLLEFMDQTGISVSMLSLTAPGIEGWAPGTERDAIARRINDYGADLVAQNSSRFGYMATIGLPKIDSALKEIVRAYDDLKVDGIALHSNYEGTYLADTVFDPVWELLDERGATVFLHPTTPRGLAVLKDVPSPMTDYPAETTRCAVAMVCAGHMTRYRNVKIILSHGGGFLPYAATRFAVLRHSLVPQESEEQITKALKSFYFDTALVPKTGLPSLLAFAPRDRIVFGTDYCYAPPDACAEFTRNLDSYQGLTMAEIDEINKNGKALFSRLASRP